MLEASKLLFAPPESHDGADALKLAQHLYRMNTVLLALLANQKPELAVALRDTLSCMLGDHSVAPQINPGHLTAAADLLAQLSVIVKTVDVANQAAAKPAAPPPWLKGVVNGGLA